MLELLAGALPRATLTMFPELGHMGPITHPAVVNPAIASHIASLAASVRRQFHSLLAKFPCASATSSGSW